MGHSAIDEVKAQAAAAEEKVQRAEAELSRLQVSRISFAYRTSWPLQPTKA